MPVRKGNFYESFIHSTNIYCAFPVSARMSWGSPFNGEWNTFPYPPLLLQPGFPLPPIFSRAGPSDWHTLPPILRTHPTHPEVSPPIGWDAQRQLSRPSPTLTVLYTSLPSSCHDGYDRVVWFFDSSMSLSLDCKFPEGKGHVRYAYHCLLAPSKAYSRHLI